MKTLVSFIITSTLLFTADYIYPSEPSTSSTPLKVCTHNQEKCRLLNQWYVERTASGNFGDYYDNRDRGHSSIILSGYPQLTAVSYTPEELRERVDWAGQHRILPFVTIGNSSTASAVKRRGSNVRGLYYTQQQGLQFLYAQYRSSNLYIYPEHRDHDIGHNGHPGYGDLYPTNSPYVVISQGSSGSDRPFMNAFVHTLAALRPEVKQLLARRGMLMSTLQMIFRACNNNITYPDEYLTGKAHPTVFVGKNVDPLKMVKMAHDIKAYNTPPMVQLQVLDETFNQIDSTYFEIDQTEKLADTPGAIARIMRGPEYTKTITVSARGSLDLNFQPLTYHWVVLRGDPSKIQITPRHGGAIADLIIAYHERHPISEDSAMASNRVDIGVFVHNGKYYSAPAFITVFTLDNERRSYDNQGRLIEVDFNASDIGFTIDDWPAFFQLMDTDNEELIHCPLHQAFTTDEKNALKNIGQALQPVYTHYLECLSTFKLASAKYHAARKDMQMAKRTLQVMEQKNKTTPSYETNHNVMVAQSGNATASKTEAKAKKEVQESRRDLSQAKKAVDEVITQKNPSLARLHSELNTMLNHPRFYIDNAEPIDQWLDKHTAEAIRNKIRRRQSHLEQSGLFTKKQLTASEKYQLKRLNLLILTEALYPQFLNGWESPNFVDPRLSKLRPIRYRYEYDEQGSMINRTEYPHP